MNTYKILSAAALVLLSATASQAESATKQDGNSLTVKVTKVRETGGRLMLALYDDERAFNNADENRAYASFNLKLTSVAAQLAIYDLPKGRYAAMLFHDENGNGQFDIRGDEPLEGYGISGAMHALDEPSFKKASVEVGTGKQSLTVRMHYFK